MVVKTPVAAITDPLRSKKADDLGPDPLRGPPRATGASIWGEPTSSHATETKFRPTPIKEWYSHVEHVALW